MQNKFKKVNLILGIILAIVIIATYFLFKSMETKKDTISYPFFISTKYSKVNVRTGPGTDYPITWIYTKKYIPLKVTLLYNDWYNIEDISGKTGWITKANASSQKSVFVTSPIKVYSKPSVASSTTAVIEKKVLLLIKKNKNNFYKIVLKTDQDQTIEGWIENKNIWGIN